MDQSGDAPVLERSAPSTDAPVRTSSRRVLAIDDGPDNLALYGAILGSRSGTEVIAAATAEEGLARAIEALPDLILLDVLLPDRHGDDLLRDLRSDPRTAAIPVIVVTVLKPEDVPSQLREGTQGFVTKPVDPVRLLSLAGRLLGGPLDSESLHSP